MMLNITAFKTLIIAGIHLRGCHSLRNSGKNQFLPGHGKSGIFTLSRKIYISESSRKNEISSKYELLHLVWAPFMRKDYGTFLFWFSTSRDVLV